MVASSIRCACGVHMHEEVLIKEKILSREGNVRQHSNSYSVAHIEDIYSTYVPRYLKCLPYCSYNITEVSERIIYVLSSGLGLTICMTASH